MSIDPRAASGFAAAADAYERGRPGYPTAAIDTIVDELSLSGTSRVLDLAAGTGQLSRRFQPRVGATIAVEPSREMRARLAAELPGVTALPGTAEAIPLADAAVDAVVVGEAFHWFATEAATDEIARVLKPAGGLALLWNVATWSSETTPWLDDFRGLVAHHRREAGDYPAANGTWREEFDRTQRFGGVVHFEFAQTQTLEPTDFVAQVASWSWIANLEAAHRRAVLDDVLTLVGDAGAVTIPHRTDLYLARRG